MMQFHFTELNTFLTPITIAQYLDQRNISFDSLLSFIDYNSNGI